MKDIIEIRWHARGGQGAKTAAVFLAEAVIEAGRFSQGFPEYGPERMGAPIRAFNRIGDRQIRVNCSVDEPDAVVILDSTLLQTENVAEGAKEDSVFIVNTKTAPDEIRQRLNLSNGKVYTVDATQIALDEIGRPIPNMPMIGALIRVMEIVSPEIIYAEIQQKFSGKFSQKIIDGNIKAAKRAYNELKG
jgi:pyruvate ferredoxin oxidoreductase gamma subunit